MKTLVLLLVVCVLRPVCEGGMTVKEDLHPNSIMKVSGVSY